MSTFLITYDLNKERHARGVYAPIIKFIKEDCLTWARLSESSYAVVSNLGPQEIYNRLSGYLDSDDNLYVITLKSPYWGKGPKLVNEWLAKNLQY